MTQLTPEEEVFFASAILEYPPAPTKELVETLALVFRSALSEREASRSEARRLREAVQDAVQELEDHYDPFGGIEAVIARLGKTLATTPERV